MDEDNRKGTPSHIYMVFTKDEYANLIRLKFEEIWLFLKKMKTMPSAGKITILAEVVAIHYLQKRNTISNDCYACLLQPLTDEIKRKAEQLKKCCHIVTMNQTKIKQLNFELGKFIPNFGSDYFLFQNLKKLGLHVKYNEFFLKQFGRKVIRT